jgi:RNA polymerase sigma-70 factor, ECF subfamily
LLKLAASGDSDALGRLFQSHRQRLERMVRVRLDHRVQSRMNASDVIQETYIEAGERLKEYVENPQVPFFVWLRYLAHQRLQQLHRHHLGRQIRDANRERSIDQQDSDDQLETGFIATQLVARFSSANSILQREELCKRLHELLDRLQPVDREILVLRHFEQLTNVECAQILRLSKTAASNRYVRALERLRAVIGDDGNLIFG